MESNVKLTVTSTEAFDNTRGYPVINNEKADKRVNSTINTKSYMAIGSDNKCENGFDSQQCNKSESVISKEKEQVIKRFNYNDTPPTKLIGDDGTTITVKDVSATKNISMSKESPFHCITRTQHHFC